MKNSTRSITFALAVAFILALSVTPARALTADEIAGIYRGTSVATLPSGERIYADLTATFRRSGNVKVVATVNGQSVTSRGNFRFVSGDVILQEFPTSESVAFVELSGDVLKATLVAKESNGEIVSEVTTLTLVQKL